jgi:PBSX family phage terminase large subunit
VIGRIAARVQRLEARWRKQGKYRALRLFPEWLAPEISDHQWATDIAGRIKVPGADWQYQALPAQRNFHRELRARFKGYSGPIGSGKSYALAYEALFLSRMNPGLLGLMGAPTYRMLHDSTQRTFFEVLDGEGIDYTFNKQQNHLRFASTGSEVIFRTMETPERLRGVNLAWFALDELTYTREDAWTRVIGRLRHPDARRLCGCAVWTPKGYDWVHHRFVEQPHSDYFLVRATPKENTYLPSDFYDQLKNAYAERFYRQEALGEYLDVYGGNAYYAFSEENVREVEYDPNLALCWALDFNVDPICSVICQIEENKQRSWHPAKPRNRTLRVLDEIVLADSNTEAAVQEFAGRIENLPTFSWVIPLSIYGDASGNSRTTKSARTDYQVLEEYFHHQQRFRVVMRQNTANPTIRDRVNTVNNMLKSASGTRNIYIHPRCKELLKDLRQVRWHRDAAGNPTGELDKSDPKRTHVSDALSYLVAQEWGLRPLGGERPGLVQ